MIYRSNLTAPDLSPHFKLRTPPKQIMGHDAPSDPDFEPECTYWTHDEAAILYNVAGLVKGSWLDIGSRFGWTAKHINWITNGPVICIDPTYDDEDRLQRFCSNTGWNAEWCFAGIFDEWLVATGHGRLPHQSRLFSGCVIDGNHDAPWPESDAVRCHLNTRVNGAVILFHDFWGKPIREGVKLLMNAGYNCRVYYTPNGVACCWRGLPDFHPPDHVRDPNIDWRRIESMIAADFPMERCV